MSEPKVRIVVPRRVDCGERDRLWRYCRPRWELDGWDLHESHDNGDGPFNRAATINWGAAGTWDVLVVIDGDVVIDGRQVRDAVRLAHDTGRLVVPYEARRLVTADGTRRILAGQHPGSWDTCSRRDQNAAHCSSVVVVPRGLWDEVGGFDDRFVGWGGEDDAFHAACLVMGGGVERLPGFVYHLHHRPSPERDWTSPLYAQCKALAERYVRLAEAGDRAGMGVLIGERRERVGSVASGGPWDIVAVVATTGDREHLGVTLASFEKRVAARTHQRAHGLSRVTRRLMCVDTADPDVVDGLAVEFPGWDVVRTGTGAGYAAAMQGARAEALRSGQPFVWWMEDDFRFDADVDLGELAEMLDTHSRVVQVSLMRQAWYEHERAAGGVVAANPDAFTLVPGRWRFPWLAHRAYWTQNPHLAPRELLTVPWPGGKDSERRFGVDLFAARTTAIGAVYGTADDAPRVHHLGDQQAGHGY